MQKNASKLKLNLLDWQSPFVFGIAAMPFPDNGILLNQFNQPRVNPVFTQEFEKVHYYISFPIPYIKLLWHEAAASDSEWRNLQDEGPPHDNIMNSKAKNTIYQKPCHSLQWYHCLFYFPASFWVKFVCNFYCTEI